MPGLPQRNAQFSNASSSLFSPSCTTGSVSANGIWSKHRDNVTSDQLQKFWSELSPHARQKLLRIDKQTLFEQARKNHYCSRCNGLLLEGFSQIVMYGKSLQQDGAAVGHLPSSKPGASKIQNDSMVNTIPLSLQNDIQDPSLHPWGGLTTTRDGILSLLDCFLDAKSFKALQNVFDCARTRERERKLLYPDACGGGDRGWISQGLSNYCRGHGSREACALHTARLSCDTLVNFWSAIGDEAQKSLLRMKEEDFIERLMYRFDRKSFCRDCRRNVIREFKELKELKRMWWEPRCTSWFCVADTAFLYEVSDDTVQADWHQSLTDTIGTYRHFEWAVGTGKGKSDILEFEDVGMNESVQVNGLDLGDLNACFITLRAWKLDGHCNELSVKAHALKGKPCVHHRLVVEDGFVKIRKGDCIRRFFEHAEEAEEEEDDESDKDGNELDGEGSRLQKHAKSPELAREFLLDAATVIFKEQVEKAFREGTARQNAHSIFICLALKLLEECVHVASKEIITFEKQIKLLEEEEKEKCEEEERKQRRRTKEREKKLRRKERLKEKEREREKNCVESKQIPNVSEIFAEESSPSVNEELNDTINSEDSISETGDTMPPRPFCQDIQDKPSSNGYVTSEIQNPKDAIAWHSCSVADGELSVRDGNGSVIIEQSTSSRWKLRFGKEFKLDPASKWCDRLRQCVDSDVLVNESESRLHGGYMEAPSRYIKEVNIQSRSNPLKSNSSNRGPKFGEKFHCFNNRMRDRYDFRSCRCNLHSDHRTKNDPHVARIRLGREIKTESESASDVSRLFCRNNRYNHGCYLRDSCAVSKSKLITGNTPSSRYLLRTKKVWEPMESQKKYPQSNSYSDITLKSSTFEVDECEEVRCNKDETQCQQADNLLETLGELSMYELSGNSDKAGDLNNYQSHEDKKGKESRNSSPITDDSCQNGFDLGAKASYYSKDGADEKVGLCPIIPTYSINGTSDPIMSSTSSSDNCSSCLSEGDSSMASSSTQNTESLSMSDSEDSSQQSEGREMGGENGSQKCPDVGLDYKHNTDGGGSFTSRTTAGLTIPGSVVGGNFLGDPPTNNSHNLDYGRVKVDMGSQQHHILPSVHNQGMHLPVFLAPSTIAYNQRPACWSAAPANGLMPLSQSNCYPLTSPLGYGILTNRPSHFCMQYSARQPLSNTVLDMGQIPVHQLVNKSNGVNSKEQNRNSKPGVSQEAMGVAGAVVSEHPVERPVPNGQAPPEAPSCGEDGHARNTPNLQNDSKNFSLFHFGGPIAVATGYNLNPVSLKDGIFGDFSSNSPADPTQADLAFTKKETTVEEYSLFAANNGTRFSFF